MNKMKELSEKFFTFIKEKKGYCILAAALIVLLILVVPNLNIETAKQHDDRKNQETKKRQELMEQLEASEDDKEAETVSGQSVLSAKDNNGQEDEIAGQIQPDGQNPLQSSQDSSDAQAPLQNSTQSDSLSQNTVQNGSQNSTAQDSLSATLNPAQTNSQNQINNQTPSQNIGQTGNQTQTNNQTPSQGTTQNQPQEDSSSEQKEEYIMVTVRISCDSVLDNPELSTAATLPSDGVLIETKTVVKKGETVYDALKAVCTDHGISYTSRGSSSSAYIVSIGGLSEKECGKYSGWKYKVNEIVSGKGCGAYKLSQNDVVEWYYATSITQ